MAWVREDPEQGAGSIPDAPRRVWRVTGHADVLAALTHAQLLVPGAVAGHQPVDVRRDPVRSGEDRQQLRTSLDGHASALLERALAHASNGVELISQVANPFGVHAAALMLNLHVERVEQLLPDARIVWRDAAVACWPGASADALRATTALARFLGDDAVYQVQAFVALTHSLPALLGNLFAFLLGAPLSGESWRVHPRPIVEELLRIAGPSRVVYRVVGDPLAVGRDGPTAGDVVAIDLQSANHDPRTFHDPLVCLPTRVAPPHVAFGWTPNACHGAGAIRLALASVTHAWVQTFGNDATHISARSEEDGSLVTMRGMRSVYVTRVGA